MTSQNEKKRYSKRNDKEHNKYLSNTDKGNKSQLAASFLW